MVLLTPVLFMLNIPYVIPITMGLIGTPASIVSVSSGVAIYYIFDHITTGVATLNASESGDAVAKFRFVIDGILDNKTMMVTIAAFAVTLVLVYFIRRMSVDYSWTLAIVAGGMANVVILLIGDLVFNTNSSVLAAIFGTAVSIGLAMVLQFFVFNVDYSRTERVQFEDDEYYYYVKAVPKIALSTPEKRVKKINPQRTESNSPQRTGTNTSKSAGTNTNTSKSVETMRTTNNITRREDILSKK